LFYQEIKDITKGIFLSYFILSATNRLAPLYQNTTQGESFSQDIHDASAPVFILEGSGSEYPISKTL